MAKEASVAPKERINIVYKPATGDAKEEVELPLKMLMVGDYTLRPDDTPLEDRAPINVDKDNFNDVMTEQKLAVDINVAHRLSGNDDDEMSVSLKFDTLKDFAPDAIARQVPELEKLLELREALTALKGPLGNVPGFRKKLQALIDDDDKRDELMKEIGLGGDRDSDKDS